MFKNDKEAIDVIKRLISLDIEDEDEWSLALRDLEQYTPGSAEILIHSKKLPSPEDVLRMAREKNKVIYL